MAKKWIGVALVLLSILSKPVLIIAYMDLMKIGIYTKFKKIITSYQVDNIRMPY